jgi:hypothetical protein
VRLERQREEDGVHAALFDDARCVRALSDDRDPPIRESPFARVVVDEPDGPQSCLRVLGELVDDRAAEPSGPDDEHPAHAVAVTPGLLEVAADRRPSREDQENVRGEEEEENRVESAVATRTANPSSTLERLRRTW